MPGSIFKEGSVTSDYKKQNRMESPTAIRVLSWQATVYKQLALDYY